MIGRAVKEQVRPDTAPEMIAQLWYAAIDACTCAQGQVVTPSTLSLACSWATYLDVWEQFEGVEH
jgi:hypothetical protein